MPNANPIDGATQPDTGAGFRQRPHGHDSAKEAPSNQRGRRGRGLISMAYEPEIESIAA